MHLHNSQWRSLATSAQKRTMVQQKKVGGDKDKTEDNTSKDTTSKETPETAESSTTTQPNDNPTVWSNTNSSPPASLIRTDFAFNSTDSSSSNNKPHELTMSSGYEIPLTNTTGSTLSSLTSPGKLLEDAQTFSYVDYKDLYDPNIHLPSAPQNWDDYEAATPLWEELAAQIGVLGRPMTVAEFMQHALLHPKYGYYSQPMRDRAEQQQDSDDDDLFSDSDDENDDDDKGQDNPIFGPRGDFVTAPEICQVFGESIQVWMVTQWEAMGKPKAIQWVEFGPGRGILMADMVRFALSSRQQQQKGNSEKLVEYGNALQIIHFIEPSHPLRRKQQDTLQEQLGDLVNWEFFNPVATDDDKNGTVDAEQDITTIETSTNPTIQVHWHDSFASLTAMIMRRKQRKMGHETTTSSKADDEAADVSNMPLFVICQEFFDALPVHAFEMTDSGVWRERMVDMAISDEMLEENTDSENRDDESRSSGTTTNKPDSFAPATTSINDIEGVKRPRLRIVLAPEVTPALKTLMRVDDEGKVQDDQANTLRAEVGQVVEVCPEGILVVQDIAAILDQQGGAAVIVDYGEEGSTDSLRGFWKHKQTHFLSLPGQTDVTADVDFTALKHAVNHARLDWIQQLSDGKENDMSNEGIPKHIIKAHGPITQGKFLVSMGAQERVISHIQKDSTTDEEAEDLFGALNRLVAPEEMGTRYKVLGIAAERQKEYGSTSYSVPPPGF